MGSSHEPGTDSMTMLLSGTPHDSNFALVPSRSGSMISAFQRACTMPMRRLEPSCCSGVGPFMIKLVCLGKQGNNRIGLELCGENAMRFGFVQR